MEQPVMMTPHYLINVILASCAAIITISGAIAVIAGLVDMAKSPNKKQDERLNALGEDVKKINARLLEGSRKFDSDAERMEGIEASMRATNKVIIESLQALTAHAIDGNNTQELKEAKHSLDLYLRGRV